MYALVRAFADIAIRRSGPQDLPASGLLLGATIVAYLLTQLPLALMLPGTAARALQMLVADTVLIGSSLALLLWLTGRMPRYRQTATAVFGTSALLSLLTIPFYLWRTGLSAAQLEK